MGKYYIKLNMGKYYIKINMGKYYIKINMGKYYIKICVNVKIGIVQLASVSSRSAFVTSIL